MDFFAGDEMLFYLLPEDGTVLDCESVSWSLLKYSGSYEGEGDRTYLIT